jgi:oligoendopeptidase F
MEKVPVPKWSLLSIYEDFETPKHQKDVEALKAGTTQVSMILQESPASVTEKTSWLKRVLDSVSTVLALNENLAAFAYTRYSTDTRDTSALRGLNAIEEISLDVQAVSVKLRNRMAELLADDLQTVLEAEPLLQPYAFILSEMIEEQQHQMSEQEEALAADLERSGGEAWGRLQEAVSSTISTIWNEQTGEKKTVTELRALAYSADRAIREKAYRKELELWKMYEVPLASAINGVKGSAISLNKRRKYHDSLEKPLFQARITEKTLDSLIMVMEESLPMFREYLKLKASAAGLEKISFYDIFAPIKQDSKVWSFDEARNFIIERFSEFHPGMGAFAENAFSSAWIDAQPRDGKVGGAYCIGFPLQGESRVLCNFDGSLSSVSTIAHELGHAYHGFILKDEPPLLGDYPMTLAETASIFAETVIFHGAMVQAGKEEKVVVIENFLQESTQVIVDILSRFYFEKELFARREASELMPDELCSMMIDAQKKTYGDGLNPEELHPYMWAVKGHYYRPELAFYNFPYAFGQLFGLGLYARYQAEGDSFRDMYDKILYLTGRKSAGDVARHAGFDIEKPDFWRQGIAVIAGFVNEFRESLQPV